jgi:short-subunit dehydrogenase
MRLELASHGIDVTTICPGFIRTDMTARNTIPMPFLLDCDAAVTRIISAMRRRKAVYNFPRRLYWLIQISKWIPEGIVLRLTAPAAGKSYKKIGDV